MMIKAVIFDMDGLMFDTERIYMKAWDYAGEQCGFGKTGYMGMKTLGMNYEKTRQAWYEEFGADLPEEKLISNFVKYIKKYFSEHKVPVKKGLYELISYLEEKKIKMAIASSSSMDVIRYALNDAKLLGRIPVIISGDMIRESKPAPEIYQKACEQIEERPADCMALEDSKSGLFAAFRAGLKPVMVPDLWKSDEETENILFGKAKNLSEIIKIMESVHYM